MAESTPFTPEHWPYFLVWNQKGERVGVQYHRPTKTQEMTLKYPPSGPIRDWRQKSQLR